MHRWDGCLYYVLLGSSCYLIFGRKFVEVEVERDAEIVFKFVFGADTEEIGEIPCVGSFSFFGDSAIVVYPGAGKFRKMGEERPVACFKGDIQIGDYRNRKI